MTDGRTVGRSVGKAAWVRAAFAIVLLSVGPTVRPSDAQDTIPIGYGSLRRDDVSVRFRTQQVEVQLVPLDERVTRLLAPDTYKSFSLLLKTRATELAEAAARGGAVRPIVFMVTFLGVVQAARFAPEDVTITSRGRLYRPLGIVPLSPRWSSNQLEAREQAAALYLYEDGIGLDEPFTVTYLGVANDSWGRAVPLLQREHARVAARAGATPTPAPAPVDTTKP
jgi:hypothetical protein